MALSQRQMRAVGAILAILLLAGAVGIVFYQMKEPRKVMVVESGPSTPQASANGAAPIAAGKPVKGVIVDGEGRPVVGAEVVLVPQGYGFDLNGPRSNFQSMRSDKDGGFDFAQPSTWADLVAIADNGIAQVAQDQMPTDGKIAIKPWGHIEGTYLAGKTPQANRQLSLSPMSSARAIATTNPASPYRLTRSGSRVYMMQRASTDAEGHFAFNRVPPGSVMISTIFVSGGMGRSSNLATVDVRPGETTTVQIGGKGRPVIGKVAVEGTDDNLPPISGSINVIPPAAGAAQRALLPGPNWPKLSDQERQKIIDDWMAARMQFSLQAAIAVEPDGTFRAEDIPAGQHSIHMYSQSIDQATRSVEIAADATVPLTIPPMPEGRSDEALDVGTITLKIRPRVKIGTVPPALEATKADGSVVKLSDLHGKYLLLALVFDYGTLRQPDNAELQRAGGVLADRFDENGIVKLAVVVPQNTMAKNPIAEIPGWITATASQQNLDPAYSNSRGSFLIDPQGTVLAKLGSYGNAGYGAIDRMLGLMKNKAPGVEVSIEKLNGQEATRGFVFRTLPTISKDDAGQSATFSIVDGRKANFGGDVEILNDGLGPRHERDERLMMCFEPGNVEGRIGADLGKAIDVEAINSYSWYKDSHRWAQVYRVYGSDGTAANFSAEPKIGTNPTSCGWTFIADVDTRTAPGGTELRDDERGQTAVSVRAEKGTLGKFRYLLFVTFACETHNQWGQEFWAEIDVIGK